METPTNVVFVGNLSWGTSDEDLVRFMSQAGDVAEARIQRYEDTHRSKGWALCVYTSSESARLAVATLDREKLNGRQVHLHLDRNSVDSTADGAIKVFAGNLEWSVTEQDLLAIFEPFHPISCHLLTNMYGRSRGFAILKFSSMEHAREAIENRNHSVVNGRPLEVRIDRGNGRGEEAAELRASVYVGKLGHAITDDAALEEVFRHIGPIVSAKVQRAPNGRSKEWGIVKFLNATDARSAVETMNGYVVPGTRSTLEVRLDRR